MQIRLVFHLPKTVVTCCVVVGRNQSCGLASARLFHCSCLGGPYHCPVEREELISLSIDSFVDRELSAYHIALIAVGLAELLGIHMSHCE